MSLSHTRPPIPEDAEELAREALELAMQLIKLREVEELAALSPHRYYYLGYNPVPLRAEARS